MSAVTTRAEVTLPSDDQIPPGIGPILAAGPLAMALGGAAAGAGMGGLAGSIAGLGVPTDDARSYEAEVKKGSVFVSVRAADAAESERAEQILTAPLPR